MALLRLLGATPGQSQRALAASLGMSIGKANHCLKALIGKGFVKAQNYRKSGNKRAYLYLLTPAGVAAKAELTRIFLATKRREYEELRCEIERLQGELSAPALPAERADDGAPDHSPYDQATAAEAHT